MFRDGVFHRGLSDVAACIAVDLDDSGTIDFVLGRPGSEGVAVMLGLGDGTFESPNLLETAGEATSPVAADVNLDGALDVAVANLVSDSVSVFLGDGRGNLLDHQTFDVRRLPRGLAVADLNGDGLPEIVAMNNRTNDLSVLLNETPEPISTDLNASGIPDGCEDFVTYHRGDSNADGAFNLADATDVVGYVFLGTETPDCLNATDSNGDTRLDIADAVFIVIHLFRGGSPPPAPGSTSSPCGATPDDELLGCESYAPCGSG